MLFPSGLDFISAFFGCLYAGVVPVPVHPPRPYRASPRIKAIIGNSQPAVVLSTSAFQSRASRRFAETPELLQLEWFAVDEAVSDGTPAPGIACPKPPTNSDSLAFLQYTSGSTASPKGVMVTHGNLLHNSAIIQRAFETGPESRGVFWLPLYHDMGLIGGVIQTLFCGGTSTLLSPAAFLQRPLRWLEAISRTQATISGGPDFAYDLCARHVSNAPPSPSQQDLREQDLSTLDLSTWDLAFTAAEPIRPETLRRFAAAFAPFGFREEAFYPCYGLAECTLMASGGRKAARPVVKSFNAAALAGERVVPQSDGEAGGRELVGCGKELPGQHIAIVDADSRTLCRDGRVGEIWIAGPSVACGYLDLPEDNQAVFSARLADMAEGPFLRSGDLGFLHEGELFVTGRLKDLIIIRGRNHYPHDVEWSAAHGHPLLRPSGSAAFSVDRDGQERLIVLQEIERDHGEQDAADALDSIRRAVALQHDIETYEILLLAPGEIPRTSSGKVQRHLCRKMYLDEILKPLARWKAGAAECADLTPHEKPVGVPSDEKPSESAIQAWLAGRLAERLGVPARQLDVNSPFAAMGLSSAQAVAVSGELEQWLHRRLSPTLIYNYPTIASLAHCLANGSSTSADHGHPPGSDIAARHADANLMNEVSHLSDQELEAYIAQEFARLQ